MEALIITIPLSLGLAGLFLWLFIWCVRNGQMEKIESKKNIIFNKSKGKINDI